MGETHGLLMSIAVCSVAVGAVDDLRKDEERVDKRDAVDAKDE